MSGRRYTVPVDVHLILRRESGTGPEVLVSRRAGAVYAAGLWHLPSGHLDGPHEDMTGALIREAREETGVVVGRADVRAAVGVHHRAPGGDARVGFFFEVLRWAGEPRLMEPHLCDAMLGPGWTRCPTRWWRTAGPDWTPTGPVTTWPCTSSTPATRSPTT